jgi:hypothetical protein
VGSEEVAAALLRVGGWVELEGNGQLEGDNFSRWRVGYYYYGTTTTYLISVATDSLLNGG